MQLLSDVNNSALIAKYKANAGKFTICKEVFKRDEGDYALDGFLIDILTYQRGLRVANGLPLIEDME